MAFGSKHLLDAIGEYVELAKDGEVSDEKRWEIERKLEHAVMTIVGENIKDNSRRGRV